MPAGQRPGSPAEPAASLFSFEVDQTVRLTTVGIDIGSATSQMSVSRIELERIDNRYVTTRRELRYESEILLTPYADAETIDTAALRDFFAEQYAKAGVSHDEIDTGAIILTGLALAKHNSRNIADLFAAQAGKFVAVSAGDAIESTLACRGAGIERLSRDSGRPVVHIDMGGGTTKYSYVANGDIERVAAVDIGARLVLAADGGRRVLRIEEPASLLLASAGVEARAGDVLADDVIELLADRMAGQVLAHAGLAPDTAADARLLRTPPLFASGQRPDASCLVTFSGGVSEYIYDRQARSFGDLGRPLADAVLRALEKRDLRAHDVPRGIRATVLGASQYSLQLTGNTVFVTSQSLVPVHNVPVVKPRADLGQEELDAGELTDALSRALAARRTDDTRLVAIALSWRGSATYQRIDALAQAVVATADGATGDRPGAPVVLVCDADIAGLLGQHISDVSGNAIPVLALDSIEVSEFDFLDVGAFVPGTGALPVVVKSLLFPTPAGTS